MDVGDPSNFVRIRQLYDNDFSKLTKNLSSYSFDDETTKSAMASIYENSKYVADPHGAVGYLGLKKYQQNHPDTYGIFLETAHPVKFIAIVEKTLKYTPEIPRQIQKVMNKEKVAIQISNYDALKSYLMTS